MRAFLLSMDAIVASGLFLLMAVFIAGFSVGFSNSELQLKQVYYEIKDINNVLFNAKISDLQDYPLITALLDNSSISEEDLDLTFIELVGYWWSSGNTSFAENLTKALMDDITNGSIYGYEILFDETSLYRNESEGDGDALSLRTTSVITGVELGKQPKGFVGSAYAKALKKNTTAIYHFGPEGSGVGPGTQSVVTKYYFVNTSDLVNNATLYISMHSGFASLSASKIRFNGNEISISQATELHTASKQFQGSKNTTLYFGFYDMSIGSQIQSGMWNDIEVELDGNNVWHTHTHPGYRLELGYQKNDTIFESQVEKKTLYFDNVLSVGGPSKESGAWQVVSFYIPENVNINSSNITDIHLYLYGNGLDDVPDGSIPAEVPADKRHNILVFLNNQTIYNGTPPGNDYDWSQSFNITKSVKHGTNVVSVFFNCWGDYFWGVDNTEIYSNPRDNKAGSSRVEITYLKPEIEKNSGHIVVGVKELLGGGVDNPKIYNKSFIDFPVLSAFLHLATLDVENITVDKIYPGTYRFFQTEQQFSTPTKIYLSPNHLSLTQNNTLNISDNCTDQCFILPESSIEYFIWLKHIVGYGAVFDTAEEAIDDALIRLEAQLGQYAEVTDYEANALSVSGIPSLWGPLRMEVRAWL